CFYAGSTQTSPSAGLSMNRIASIMSANQRQQIEERWHVPGRREPRGVINATLLDSLHERGQLRDCQNTGADRDGRATKTGHSKDRDWRYAHVLHQEEDSEFSAQRPSSQGPAISWNSPSKQRRL